MSCGVCREGARQKPRGVRTPLQRIRSNNPKSSGGALPKSCTGSRSGTRCSSGMCPGRSGLSAARSTSPTTASTATCKTWRKNKAAIIWESEPGEVRTLHLPAAVGRKFRSSPMCLKSLGVKKGDRVAIYMGMTPELPIAMLACARIGAPHSVVFGGFSSQCARRSHPRFAGRRGHHAGRLLSSRRRGQAVSRGRGSAQIVSVGEACRRVQAHRNADQLAVRTRSLVA